MLTPKDLANGQPPKPLEPVQVPAGEWKEGESIHVARLTALEWDELEAIWTDYRDGEGGTGNTVGIRPVFVAFGWCNEKNQRYNKTAAEVLATAEQLKGRAAAPCARAFDVFTKINNLLKQDLEALEGN